MVIGMASLSGLWGLNASTIRGGTTGMAPQLAAGLGGLVALVLLVIEGTRRTWGITLPLVILGVVLSTLHQSSLGSLFLSMPEKLNPPWYSPLLPLFFFISAVGVGQAMVIFESSISSRAFQRGLEIDLLGKLAQAILYVLGVYLVLRFGDLGVEGKLALLFWLEVTVGAVLPIIWFARRVNRANPHLMEFAISFGIISAGILTFGVVAKYFPLFEYGAHAAGHATAQPVPSPVTVPATARSEAT